MPEEKFRTQDASAAEPPQTAYSSSEETYRRYRAFVARAVEVFGDELIASQWLRTPQQALGNKSPLDVAQAADFDSSELELMLGRLEHGVFA